MRAPPGFRGEFRTDDTARALYAEGAGIFRIIPGAVAVPAGLDDLVALVRWAARERLPLVPRGAGSGMPGGNIGPGIVVDLSPGFREPPAIDPDARTARCGASISYQALNGAAAGFGLRLPPDPSSGAFCTLGGMVATNAAGAHSVKYGAMRRWVRALDFVTADGETGRTDAPATRRTAAEERFERDVAPELRSRAAELAGAVPHTTKNSAGYALDAYAASGRAADLLTGSEGTLAIATAVEVALAPLPDDRSTLLVTLRSLEDVGPAVLALRPLGPSAVELLDRTYLDFVRGAIQRRIPDGTEAVLLVELEGDGRAAADAVRGLAETTELADDVASVSRLWELRHLASPILAALPNNLRSLQLVEDGCVPVAVLGRYIRALRDSAAAFGFTVVIFGHAGDGHLHANLLADVAAPGFAARLFACLEAVTGAQLSLGGTPSGEHGDGRLRAPFLAPTFGEAYAELCRRTKAAWDPAGTLNPGVKVPAPGAGFDAGMLKVGSAAPPLPAEIAARLREIERTAGWGTFRLSLAPAPAAA
ncbi:MAG TPA: FAD-binding oxidoreductase [Gemmatimonadales bacterium]|nr:FAD-binding oxidoreductase [Gemmatimonadales bacterium]